MDKQSKINYRILYKIISTIIKIKIRCPNLRTGQIIWNAVGLYSRTDLFYTTDEELLKSVLAYSENIKII